MPLTPEQQAERLFWRIALPSRLAQYLGKRVMGRPYIVYPWLEYVEREIVEMFNRPGREVKVINISPQEGKTTYCGMWLPFWLIGMRPDEQGIFVTYSDEYSTGWGLRVRNLVEQFGEELFGIGLSKSQATANNWKTTRGFGGMLSVGIGGGITGNPGHWILIDDVIKNMEEAGSPATKRKHLEEWDGSISSRFQENTKVVITATRWAEDDLSGEIIARSYLPEYEGIPVSVVRIKAIAEPDEDEELALSPDQRADWRDVLGRRVGESLEGQHSRGFFLERRASVSPYVWSALYQASPSAAERVDVPDRELGLVRPGQPAEDDRAAPLLGHRRHPRRRRLHGRRQPGQSRRRPHLRVGHPPHAALHVRGEGRGDAGGAAPTGTAPRS